jgi:hypothetical protein
MLSLCYIYFALHEDFILFAACGVESVTFPIKYQNIVLS